MRNDKNPRIQTIYALVKTLPAFALGDLAPIEQDKTYLKILFGRYVKNGKLIRLKRNLYTTKTYLDTLEKTQRLSAYKTFLANLLYEPSYLSLEYILSEYHLLTEVPVQFTSISTRKTNNVHNVFGKFIYHSIKDTLFSGFTKKMIAGFPVLQATPAKALFDFLYLRQQLLFENSAIDELRINTDQLTKQDKTEFWHYIKKTKSHRLHDIGKHIIKH